MIFYLFTKLYIYTYKLFSSNYQVLLMENSKFEESRTIYIYNYISSVQFYYNWLLR